MQCILQYKHCTTTTTTTNTTTTTTSTTTSTTTKQLPNVDMHGDSLSVC